jgi:hypothetical protein
MTTTRDLVRKIGELTGHGARGHGETPGSIGRQIYLCRREHPLVSVDRSGEERDPKYAKRELDTRNAHAKSQSREHRQTPSRRWWLTLERPLPEVVGPNRPPASAARR